MNGIPVQFLDGTDEAMDKEQSFVESVMDGYTADVIDDIDTVVNGYDLLGIEGDGSVDDSEKLRAYLERTKSVADRYPQAICGYQDAKTFSDMLGFVLEHWDSANREQALENMANEETRLADEGYVTIGLADDDEDTVVGDVYDEEEYNLLGVASTKDGQATKVFKTKKNRNGFFSQIKKLNKNLNISSDANDIVSANTYFNKTKSALRKKIADSRKKKRIAVTDKDTHKTKTITQNVATVSGLSGIDDEVQNILQGVDFYENLNGTDTDAVQSYLTRTKNELERHADRYFTTDAEENAVLGSIETAISNINNESVLAKLSGEGMNDDEYGEYLQSLGTARKQAKRREFFKRLKQNYVPKNNPFLKPVLKSEKATKLNGFENIKTPVDVLKKTARTIQENPSMYAGSDYEYENLMGILGYAIANWDTKEAVDVLCGFGISESQYDEMEDTLGAVFSRKTKAAHRLAKRQTRAGKTISNLKRAYQNTCNENEKQRVSKLIEAEQNALNGKKLLKKVKNAIKKTTKAVAKVTKKAVTAPIKATVKATKAVAKTTKKVAKKAVKKIVKFVIKYNPITLVARAIILMACSLNMFKMAERMYPATRSEAEAKTLGLTTEQYTKSKECYTSLLKAFTKIGGKETKLVKYLQKGSKKVWKGTDTFDKSTLKNTALKNQKNISSMYDEDETELKKQGATSTSDPNVTYSETKTEVEVAQNTAVEGLYGLILNGYVSFEGLGVVATATIASGSASASGILAGILAKLKNIFASGKVKEVVKKVATNVKDKVKTATQNVVQKTKEKIQATKQKVADSNIKETAKDFVTTTVKNIVAPKETETVIPETTQNASSDKTKKIALIVGGTIAAVGLGTVIYKSLSKD